MTAIKATGYWQLLGTNSTSPAVTCLNTLLRRAKYCLSGSEMLVGICTPTARAIVGMLSCSIYVFGQVKVTVWTLVTTLQALAIFLLLGID